MARPRRPISFLLSPTTALGWIPPASRIVTSALRADDRLEAHFSSAAANIYLDSFRRHHKVARQREERGAFAQCVRLPMRVSPHLDVVAGRYDQRILSSVPTDDVLLSALSVFDLFVAKRLLDAGKRVLLGGSLTTLYSSGRIRDLLLLLGASAEQVHRSLVVVGGYATAETDFLSVVDARGDIELEATDHRSMLTCREDGLLEFLDALEMMARRIVVALPLSSGCWYGQCEFCTVRNQRPIDFAATMTAGEVLEHLREIAALYRARDVVLTDNYPQLTDRMVELLRHRAPLRLTLYGGVHLLADRPFARRLSGLVDGLRIGIESGSDFALRATRKGFDVAAIERAVDNLVDHVDRDTELTLLVVYDLPHESSDDVRRGFDRLVALKTRLRAAGFARVVVSGFPLLPFPDTELVGRASLLERVPVDLARTLEPSELAGGWSLVRWYEQAHGVLLPTELGHLLPPLRRRAADGSVLLPDLALVDEATVRFLEDPGPADVLTTDSP